MNLTELKSWARSSNSPQGWVSVISAILAIIGIAAGLSTITAPSPGQGSSEDAPGYNQPGADTALFLQQLEADLGHQVNQLRLDEIGVTNIPTVEMATTARKQVEANAAAGKLADEPGKFDQLQIALKWEDASAENFFNSLNNSPAHRAVMVNPTYHNFAIGTAYANGMVYVVIQFD